MVDQPSVGQKESSESVSQWRGAQVNMWARQASAWQATCLAPPSKLGGGALLTPLPETFSVFSSIEFTVFTMIAEVVGDGKGVQWPISPAIPGEQKISDQFARRFYQFGDFYLISCLLDLLGMIGSRRQYICLIVGSPEPEAWFNICPIESTICLANELYFCCC